MWFLLQIGSFFYLLTYRLRTALLALLLHVISIKLYYVKFHSAVYSELFKNPSFACFHFLDLKLSSNFCSTQSVFNLTFV